MILIDIRKETNIKDYFTKDLVTVDDLFELIEELASKNEKLEEELENYREINTNEYEDSIPEIHGKGISY